MEGGPDPLNWPIILREKNAQTFMERTLKCFCRQMSRTWMMSVVNGMKSESEEDDDEEELDN